ncbi:cob(I)yrinic acid a,c-diamide adenosyltransferase [bacterium]|nr:MAG: cob(I)yrinic acid a,c-diamide adenosyltransferase [bacterium]
MRIYTRTGDNGTTGLIGGARVGKDDATILAVGAIDEANATIGVARAAGAGELDAILAEAQHHLFSLGAEIATPEGREPTTTVPLGASVRLETEMDRMTAQLPPLRAFILPGGCPTAAALHHARTVVRRAETALTALSRQKAIRSESLAYLNRLSDWLFTSARLANHRLGISDVEWHPVEP